MVSICTFFSYFYLVNLAFFWIFGPNCSQIHRFFSVTQLQAFSKRILTRVHPIQAKLSDHPARLINLSHCPKGQMDKIWANLGQKWAPAKLLKYRSIFGVIQSIKWSREMGNWAIWRKLNISSLLATVPPNFE